MKLNKKKAIIFGAVALCVCTAAAMIIVRPANAQPTPRIREFPASIGTITVGVDASGTITSNKKRQLADLGVKLEDYTVKKGDYIKSGDVIARLIKSDIEEKLSLAEAELKNAENEIAKAKADKEKFISDADQKLAQTRGSAASSYNEKASPLNAKMHSINLQLTAKNEQIVKLETDIKGYEEEKAKNNPNSLNYDEMIKNARDEISRINGEKDILLSEYAAAEAQLKVINDGQGVVQKSENDSVETQKQQNSVTLSQHDSAISSAAEKHAQATAKYKRLKELLASPEVRAENEGVVLGLGFTSGAEINISAPIIETGAKEDLYLELFVDAIDFSDVAEGQEVSFYVDAYPDSTFYGTVKSKSYLQNENGKFGITVSVSEPENELYNGMGASATLIIKQKKDVITLQNKAITVESGKQYVNVKGQNGETEKREIKTGFSDGRVTEIISGISDGEIAVIEEHYESN